MQAIFNLKTYVLWSTFTEQISYVILQLLIATISIVFFITNTLIMSLVSLELLLSFDLRLDCIVIMIAVRILHSTVSFPKNPLYIRPLF